MKIIISFIFLAFAVHAQEDEQAWYKDIYIGANYSYLDLLVPGKYGASLGILDENNNAWELEYLRGSISTPWVMDDIGSITDQRITLMRKNQVLFDSFYFAYGLVYFELSAHLSDNITSAVSSDAPSGDVVKASAFGTYLSFGNMWKFAEHGFFGVDWLSWSQPWGRFQEESAAVDYLVGEDARDEVHDALSVVYRFPRFTVAKLQLGWRF